MAFVEVGEQRLEVQRIAGARREPTLVFLHEGLGSVALWKDFPERVVRRTGLPAVVYSREGYGRSAPRSAPLPPDFMQRHAREALPVLLDELGVKRALLVGHSDGASIAIVHATMQSHRAMGLVLMAPHLFVEDLSIRSIEAARQAFAETDLRERLGRYHDDPEHAFRGWNDVWLSPGFRPFDIQEEMRRVTVPSLVIQGRDDEYGTSAQYEAAARLGAGRVDLLVLDDCGHAPHRDRPRATLDAIATFAAETLGDR